MSTFIPDIGALNTDIVTKICKVYKKYRLPNCSQNRDALLLQLDWLMIELKAQNMVKEYKISFDLIQSGDAPISVVVEYKLGDGSTYKFRSTAH